MHSVVENFSVMQFVVVVLCCSNLLPAAKQITSASDIAGVKLSEQDVLVHCAFYCTKM